ncbi:MAG TPA: hypothetical protein VFX53_05120 [Pedococcus sp.]|nr:hypothetical protein [Pedococcus sp.]
MAERDRQFTETVLMLYPGTTVDVVTANVGCFARHYAGAITTDELAARTGYRLPPDARRPHNPVIKINPATDLAVVANTDERIDP